MAAWGLFSYRLTVSHFFALQVVITIVLIYLYPILIAPLFNTYTDLPAVPPLFWRVVGQ